MFRIRTEARAALTPETASHLLERAVVSARETQERVARVRPAAFCAILKANPAIVEWIKGRDGLHTPHFRTINGQVWPLDLSEQIYPQRSRFAFASSPTSDGGR